MPFVSAFLEVLILLPLAIGAGLSRRHCFAPLKHLLSSVWLILYSHSPVTVPVLLDDVSLTHCSEEASMVAAKRHWLVMQCVRTVGIYTRQRKGALKMVAIRAQTVPCCSVPLLPE